MTRLNVTRAFARLAQITCSVTRACAGAYDAHGRWQPSASDPFEFDILASVQPLTARERLLLPDNLRTKETRNVYTQTALQAGSVTTNQAADEIEINGLIFVVNSVTTWFDATPVFYIALVAAKGQG